MIETYKIITGIYDREASPVLKLKYPQKHEEIDIN